MFKIVQLEPHYAGTPLDMFNLVHYETRMFGERVVRILLEYFLCILWENYKSKDQGASFTKMINIIRIVYLKIIIFAIELIVNNMHSIVTEDQFYARHVSHNSWYFGENDFYLQEEGGTK